MRIALYCRVSTEDQKLHGLSIDTQLANLREWASTHNHTIVGEYVDAGISGKKPYTKRPALSKFVSDLGSGLEVDALVFTKLDRFFRSVHLYYQAASVLDKAKVAWIATQEDYETLTASGRFRVNIMLSVAENEADKTSERIKVVMDRKVVKGEYLGGRIPIGYKKENKHLVIDEDAAQVIRECFATLIRTGSIRDATDYLHTQGYMRSHSAVTSLLRNEIYTGHHKGNPSFCPPIISREVFNAAQAAIATPIKRPPTGRVYLLSGLVKCKECGYNMTGLWRKNHAAKYAYRCNRCYNNHLCTMTSITSENRIIDFLLTKLEVEVLSISAPVQPKTKKRKPVDNSKKLERLNDLYIEGMISKKDYLSKRKALTTPETPKETSADYSVIRELVIQGNLREQYHALTREEQRELWRSVIQEIRLAGRDVSITFLP